MSLSSASRTYDHEYTPENTRVYKGRRFCRECKRISDRSRYLAKRSLPALSAVQ